MLPNRIIEDQLGVAARMLFAQAYTHAVAIIFGYSEDPKGPKPPTVYGGSGALLALEGRTYVATCDHVIDGFDRRYKEDNRYQFQIGQNRIDVHERLIDRDTALDLAIIDVSDLDPKNIANRSDYAAQPLTPTRWPPPPVQTGEIVIVCGFPRDTREPDEKERKIVSASFSFVEHVTRVDGDVFYISFDRKTWVNTGDDSPSPDWVSEVDLGGLSGSPVFSGRDLPGPIRLLEFVGTLLSEVPFIQGDSVLIRSSSRIAASGSLIRSAQ
jgi:hypothetical protein